MRCKVYVELSSQQELDSSLRWNDELKGKSPQNAKAINVDLMQDASTRRV
jgi:hypothetical protein